MQALCIASVLQKEGHAAKQQKTQAGNRKNHIVLKKNSCSTLG
jgi:hypothetical protein